MISYSPQSSSSFGAVAAGQPALAAPWRDRLHDLIVTAVNRGRSRRALAALDAHQLRDVGLTREAALGEARKRFWQR
jgi:uncharacterized protein YjiS (DUF1127 family)